MWWRKRCNQYMLHCGCAIPGQVREFQNIHAICCCKIEYTTPFSLSFLVTLFVTIKRHKSSTIENRDTQIATAYGKTNTKHDGAQRTNMGTLLETLRQRWNWRSKSKAQPPRVVRTRQVEAPIVDIAPNDPLVAYFLSTSGAVEVDKLNLNSPALRVLKAANVKLAIPLISQGELV